MKLKPEEINLARGAHKSPQHGMCLLEAVAYIAGEPHSDRPRCVCPVLATFGRTWNDGLESDGERNRLLRPLLPRLIGTNAGRQVAEKRAWIALDWLIRVYWPAWMELTEALRDHAAILRALPEQTSEREIVASKAEWEAAGDAAWDSPWDAAGDAEWDAAWTSEWEAAGGAAWAAAGATAGDAARAAARAARAAAREAAVAAAVDATVNVARPAAREAARAALNPTTEKLKASALELFELMIATK